MDPLQLWIEGYKFRGEACKQGGIVATVLLGILSVSSDTFVAWSIEFVAGILLATSVCSSALAYLFLGRSITEASYLLEEEGASFSAPYHAAASQQLLSLNAVKSKVGYRLAAANFVGVLEIICLVLGLILTVAALV